MNKVLILAACIILCSASLVREKNVQVNEDGSILISSPTTGKRVSITRPIGPDGKRSMEIYITGPNIPTKRIQIDNDETGNEEELRIKRGVKKEKSQGDVLSAILKDYQGVVDDVSYSKLLSKIDKAVKKGEISADVYNLLQTLDQQEEVLTTSQPPLRRTLYDDTQIQYGGYGRGGILPWIERVVPRVQTGLGLYQEEDNSRIPYYRPDLVSGGQRLINGPTGGQQYYPLPSQRLVNGPTGGQQYYPISSQLQSQRVVNGPTGGQQYYPLPSQLQSQRLVNGPLGLTDDAEAPRGVQINPWNKEYLLAGREQSPYLQELQERSVFEQRLADAYLEGLKEGWRGRQTQPLGVRSYDDVLGLGY